MMAIHWLRPWWLVALLPLIALVWFYWSGKAQGKDWSGIVDDRLLPYLLVGQQTSKKIWPLLMWTLLGLLTIVALAGPAWKKLPQPVFKQQSALVILLDLSRSMNAQDIKPSRIARARLKLIDLLDQRKEGQTALVAWAATAYIVTPLTDDNDTIKSLLGSLTPQIMPAQGSRADRAIQRALELFSNAGVNHGDILLITDGVSERDQMRIDAMNLKNFRLSVLSVGSAEGAPIPLLDGGFVKDAAGSIVIAKTDEKILQKIATQHDGIYSALSLDDTDIQRLQHLLKTNRWQGEQKQLDLTSDRWREEGPWLLLLIVPLAALAFRRGFLMTVLLAFMLLPVAKPVEAFELGQWRNWFSNQQQQAQTLLQKGDAKQAAKLFQRPDWKGAAQYKAGDYDQALETLGKVNTVDAKYNRANALAKLGRLQQALKAYDEVLAQQPDNEDAAYNRKLVEQALKKQQQKDQKNQDQKNQDQKNQDQKNQDQKNQDQKNQDQKNQDQKNQDQKNQDQKNQDQKNQSQQQKDRQQKQDDKALAEQAKKDQEKEKEKEKQQKQQAHKDKPEPKSEQSQQDKKDQPASQQPEPLSEQEMKQRLDQQAEEQWLRRIPDDPGGLLRNKFRYQYSRQQPPTQEKETW